MDVSYPCIKQHDRLRCLCIIYNDNESSFTDLLEIDNSVSMHHRNIQVLATELYKFVNDLSLELVNDCFRLHVQH